MASKYPQSNNMERLEKGSAQDWQIGKTVLECNKYMFENSIDCDITFSFSSQYHQETSKEPDMISAHKYVLISRSPVFYAMLCGPARDESSCITIKDINAESFREVLR